ncbi:ABC transporter substrate-binding protein [Streptomyces sp. ISL-100]|uniref:ABC transporter substrate-binding protein n=1 Tax=Streptomyces sp. ISL-100 TaxID=2819173 RepID=UPI001BE88981|nr:extracellular solute-binding protein [Streptomyces sp. ISL-100]MBT2398474.1 extracellular solute-binding protein [Streptomyces sp. ISL-100]
MTVALAGCGSSEGGDVTLKLVAADYDPEGGDSTKQYWDGVATAFEAENKGIKVDVSIYDWKDVDRKVAEMVEAGNAPDIAQIGAYADYAAEDALYSVDEMLSIPVQANLLAPLAEAGEVSRVSYGIPFVASTRLLFYNKTLFAQAGVEPPKTWEEIESTAKALKQRGVTYPFALPLGNEEAQAETMMWMLSNGGGYTDQVGTYTIDSAQNIETFTWLKDTLVGGQLTGPVAPGKLDRKPAFTAFANGEVGMLNGHPSLLQQAAKKGVKVGMVPLPGPDGKARSSMGVADWMMGFKQHGHGKQIGKSLDFAYSDENVLEFADQYDLLPVTVSASETMAADPAHKELWPFLEELPQSTLYPVGKTSWAKVSESIKKQIGSVVGPNGDPTGTLGAIGRDAAATENAE